MVPLVTDSDYRRFAARGVRGLFCPPGMDHDDLVQAAMIGVWEAAAKWKGTGVFAAFATNVARRRALDAIRATGTRRAVQPIMVSLSDQVTPTLTVADVIEDHAPGPYERAVQAEETVERRDILGRVTPYQRTVLLWLASGYSPEEIAGWRGVKSSAIHAAASTARRKMRERARPTI